MTYEEAYKIATSTNGLLHGASGKTKGEYVDCIINALEKQIPKKPKNFQKCNFPEPSTGDCPVCGEFLIDFTDNFCGCCGQKIDWSDFE